MTTRISQEVADRRRAQTYSTMGESMVMAIAARFLQSVAITYVWPSTRYQNDPVGFARDVLGMTLWDAQERILTAVRDHPRVAVASGHKISKSFTASAIALWFYSSFPEARVVMSSVTSRQVDQILWREVKMAVSRAGRCRACRGTDPYGLSRCRKCKTGVITGELRELARSGLKSSDFREIVGFTAREAEAVAGISGKNLLYILDESSGIPQEIFEAIEGNRAGGARVVMFSNPTRNEGEFHDAFHSKREFYHCLQVSSEETPNAKEGRVVIPGLATREWIDEKKQEWGEDSALYRVRVKGQFVHREQGKIISLHLIELAENRWDETQAAGVLHLGVDPAGNGTDGDETVIAVRRGAKLIGLYPFRGLSEDAIFVQILGFISTHKDKREVPVVAIDREGPIGYRIYSMLLNHASTNQVEIIGVRSSDKASREPQIYDRCRDELWANLCKWLRDGGAIVEDTKLAAELHAPEWKQNLHGKLKATHKDELRKMLGRSPDRADALALSVWEEAADMPGADDDDGEPSGQSAMDPWADI